VGGILYLLNLPFLILAFNSPFYRARFEKMFPIAPADHGEPQRDDVVLAALASRDPTDRDGG
jgi:hypothetical protein